MAKKSDNTEVFAVIETGGKQYKVSEGDVVVIEKLPGEYKEGDTVVFDHVLMVDDGKDTSIGDPYITGASVEGEYVKEGRGKKIAVMKYRSKSRYFKNKGHRQPFSTVKIMAIK